MRKVQPIRPAATVILVREANPGFEVFMLKRTGRASFAGGMFVFPGGRVDGDDHLHKYDAVRTGPSDTQQPRSRRWAPNGAVTGWPVSARASRKPAAAGVQERRTRLLCG